MSTNYAIPDPIVKTYNEYRQTRAEFERKEKAMNLICEILRKNVQLFDGVKPVLYPFGSSISEFARIDSDLDLVIHLPGHKLLNSDFKQSTDTLHAAMCECLIKVGHELMKHPDFYSTCSVGWQPIGKSHPIIRFTCLVDKEEVHCDLGVLCGNGSPCLMNSLLLSEYCRVDSRVAPLIMAVKFWVKRFNWKRNRLLHHSEFYCGSYALELMMINYLQVCTPPVLPAIPVDDLKERLSNPAATLPYYSGEKHLFDSRAWKSTQCESNSMSPTELFQGFIDHYASLPTFLGVRLSVADGKFQTEKRRFSGQTFIVEEPFFKTNVLNVMAHSVESLAKFHWLFKEQSDMLRGQLNSSISG